MLHVVMGYFNITLIFFIFRKNVVYKIILNRVSDY